MADTIQALIEHPPQDPVERRKIHEAARKLALALETPQDAMHRFFWSGAQLPMTQIGVDLHIFNTLAASLEKEFTTEELSAPNSADPVLISRVLRYLASFALIKETARGVYRANATTEWLATPGAKGGVQHFSKTITPIFQALPATLQEQKYQNPSDPLHTAFQKAHKTTSHGYSWLPDDPSLLSAFFEYLKSQRKGQKKWTDTFDIKSMELKDEELNSGRVLLVDVGGGTGPQSVILRSTGIQGKIVLQDQQAVLDKANAEELKTNDIEAQVYDFFQEQPVKGAKAYYLKNIMHDWPDNKCVEILSRLKESLAKDSLILLQDCVLPDQGASYEQTQMDIQMMAALAAVERTQSQWQELLSRAGLRIQDILIHNEETGNSIVVAVAN